MIYKGNNLRYIFNLNFVKTKFICSSKSWLRKLFARRTCLMWLIIQNRLFWPGISTSLNIYHVALLVEQTLVTALKQFISRISDIVTDILRERDSIIKIVNICMFMKDLFSNFSISFLFLKTNIIFDIRKILEDNTKQYTALSGIIF